MRSWPGREVLRDRLLVARGVGSDTVGSGTGIFASHVLGPFFAKGCWGFNFSIQLRGFPFNHEKLATFGRGAESNRVLLGLLQLVREKNRF